MQDLFKFYPWLIVQLIFAKAHKNVCGTLMEGGWHVLAVWIQVEPAF